MSTRKDWRGDITGNQRPLFLQDLPSVLGQDGAVLRDVKNKRYADPARVKPIDHIGPFCTVAGAHLSEPPPQRSLVLFQAGASEKGLALAAQRAEGLFVVEESPAAAIPTIQRIRKAAVDARRAADSLVIFQGLLFVVGGTEEKARRKERDLDEDVSTLGLAAHMSSGMNIPMSSSDLRLPLDKIDHQPGRETLKSFSASASNRQQTLGTFLRQQNWAWGRRVVGTPEQCVDVIENW